MLATPTDCMYRATIPPACPASPRHIHQPLTHPPTRVKQQLSAVAALDGNNPVMAVWGVVNVDLGAVVLGGAVR